MAKRGGTRHLKRLAIPKAMPITNKKETTWLVKPMPGPHPSERCIPLGVFLRDVVKLAKTLREAKKVLSMRKVYVDGRVRTDEKFPIGLMDVVSLPEIKKNYRIVVDWKGRLIPLEITSETANKKIVKVVKKHTAPGGKIMLTFHDGKNMVGDNHIRVGDSIVVKLPKPEMLSHLKMENGATCLVKEGKHASKIVTLKEILKRKEGKKPEALVEDSTGSFITVLDYLMVVGKELEGGMKG